MPTDSRGKRIGTVSASQAVQLPAVCSCELKLVATQSDVLVPAVTAEEKAGQTAGVSNLAQLAA